MKQLNKYRLIQSSSPEAFKVLLYFWISMHTNGNGYWMCSRYVSTLKSWHKLLTAHKNQRLTIVWPSKDLILSACFERFENIRVGLYTTHHRVYQTSWAHLFQDQKALSYKSGVPSSNVTSGQQWDFPNAWSPLQDVVIQALANDPTTDSLAAAQTLVNNWVNSNYKGWKRTQRMFEKVWVQAVFVSCICAGKDNCDVLFAT